MKAAAMKAAAMKAVAMKAIEGNRAAEFARGLRIKRNNAITAFCIGAALCVISARLNPAAATPGHVILGLLAGILYANIFEYVLHRFLLHWGESFLVQRHALHHDSTGMPSEPRYVNFSSSPLIVVLVFALNAPAAFGLQSLLHAAIAPGIFAGFTLYYVLYEEIHWRIHFGGWLPGVLKGARRHHMLHHGGFKGRYSVFLPIFDWVFERDEWKRNSL